MSEHDVAAGAAEQADQGQPDLDTIEIAVLAHGENKTKDAKDEGTKHESPSCLEASPADEEPEG